MKNVEQKEWNEIENTDHWKAENWIQSYNNDQEISFDLQRKKSQKMSE
jgi:hypothetical protein